MIWKYLCYAFVFLSEGITAWLYLNYIFDRKSVDNFGIVLHSVGYIVLFFGSLFWSTNTNALFFCVVNLALILLNYQCSIKLALLHMALLCFLMAGSEVLAALLFDAFGYGFSAHIDNLPILFAQVLLSKLVYFILAILGSRIFSPHKVTKDDPHAMLNFCLLPLVSAFIAIFSVYLGTSTGSLSGRGIMMLMTMITLLIVNFLFLTLYNYIEKSNKEYLALQLSLQKEQADLNYYKALQKQFESQKILIHDIKKHLNAIDAMAVQCGASQIDDYVSALCMTLSPQNQAKLCTDSILNFILLQFREECVKAGVVFLCDVREDVSCFMDTASVTTLYGNLLSNALEAASQAKEKQVELSVTRNTLQSVIVLSVINTCGKRPLADGSGSFRTTKKDKVLHGVGLQSIDRVVRKYSGVATMYFDTEKYQFHHIIQFPIPDQLLSK